MFKIFSPLPLVLPMLCLGLALSCGKSSESGKPERSADLVPGGTNNPGETTPIVVQPMQVKAWKDRSTEEFCSGLTEFLQNFTATKLKGSSLALMSRNGKTCSIDSSALNLNVQSTFIFSRGSSVLELTLNAYAPYVGDTFGETTLLLDRMTTRSESFTPQSSDAVFGDITSLKSELQKHVDLKGATFKIQGLNKSFAYQRIEQAFAPGSTRVFRQEPRLRVSLSAGTLTMLEVDPGNFYSNGVPTPFLRCTDTACLENGLTYGFEGLDLIFYAKPYGDNLVKAPTRFRILADWLR